MIKCPNCPYETKRAFDLKRHLTKKNSCVPMNPTLGSNIEIGGSNIASGGESGMGGFPCRKCGKVLKSKKGFALHAANCDGVHSLQCKVCLKVFKNASAKHYHVHHMKCQPVVQHINNDNSVHNSNNIDNSVHNTTNDNRQYNQIVLMNFGCENMQHLLQDTAFMDQVLKAAASAKTPEAKAKVAPMIVQRIHFDPTHPENQTIKLTTQRGMYHAKVHTANGWQRTTWEEAIDRVNGRAHVCLEEHVCADETFEPPGFCQYIDAANNDNAVIKRQRVATRDMVLDALGA